MISFSEMKMKIVGDYSSYKWPSTINKLQFSTSFFCCSVAQSCPTLCDPMNCTYRASLSFTTYWSLFKLTCHPTLSLCLPFLHLPSIFTSIRVFSNESPLCIRWPECWSFSFSISPSKEYSGLISFRIDWFDILAVQGTLKSLPAPQVKSISSLALTFFMVQPSHPYMTTGKTIALTRRTFVGRVMALLFNIQNGCLWRLYK